MNRVYNNEGIIMACIVHILRERDMDIVLLYLVSTILIDNQLSAELYDCIDFRQLSNRSTPSDTVIVLICFSIIMAFMKYGPNESNLRDISP